MTIQGRLASGGNCGCLELFPKTVNRVLAIGKVRLDGDGFCAKRCGTADATRTASHEGYFGANFPDISLSAAIFIATDIL